MSYNQLLARANYLQTLLAAIAYRWPGRSPLTPEELRRFEEISQELAAQNQEDKQYHAA